MGRALPAAERSDEQDCESDQEQQRVDEGARQDRDEHDRHPERNHPASAHPRVSFGFKATGAGPYCAAMRSRAAKAKNIIPESNERKATAPDCPLARSK